MSSCAVPCHVMQSPVPYIRKHPGAPYTSRQCPYNFTQSVGVRLTRRCVHGRPLVLGRRMTPKGEEWAVASEDCAFGPIGFKRVRDVLPGEMIVIDPEGKLHSKQCVAGKVSSTQVHPLPPHLCTHSYLWPMCSIQPHLPLACIVHVDCPPVIHTLSEARLQSDVSHLEEDTLELVYVCVSLLLGRYFKSR